MFSIITMASSTTKPVAMVSDMSERLSSEKPNRYMTASVPTSDSGTDRLGIRVAGTLRRNTKITPTTSTSARPSSNSTSSTDARMVVVRSVRGVMVMPGGSDCCRCGRAYLMLSTTAITLAPGWRCTFMTRAGVRLAHAASSVFSGPITTLATSRMRTGPLFW
ncbi:hypothetical protein MSKU3_1187 [Komagataeibacter oboediens]|nr:hypothetical protein MSKU3_1187 [Komagataeibacter oboediens]